MEKTPAPTTSTTSTVAGSEQDDFDQKVNAAKQAFIGAALSMSWQLALVVLIPIIGGVKLDEHLGTTPALTIIGFIVASIGMALVLWRQLQVLSPVPKPKGKTK